MMASQYDDHTGQYPMEEDELPPSLERPWGPDLTASPYLLDVHRVPRESEMVIVEWDSLLDRPRKELSIDFSYASRLTASTSNQEQRAPTMTSQPDYDGSWLYPELKSALDRSDLGMECNEMFELVRDMLESDGKSNQEIEEDLIGLLGASNLSLIREIISSRQQIVQYFKSLYHQPSATNASNRPPAYAFTHAITIVPERKCAVGQSIVVQTEEEKQMRKLLNKVKKKANKEMQRTEVRSGNVTLDELDAMKREREQALLTAMTAPLFKNDTTEKEKVEPYPFVFDSYLEAKQTAAFISGHKMILPEGFRRKDDKRAEEILIPALTKPPAHIVKEYPLIEIATLDQTGQQCFAGVTHLNQIQSIVFQTAYNTNENMLVCAPTGAGKTNIAMLTVAKVIKDHLRDDGSIDLKKFKIIYIAPMKALASEMTDNFGRRLKSFGIKVRELTGDMQMTRQEIMETQMIVTTPEKWDVVTRKSNEDTNTHLINLVKLLIIDEVHLLQSDRGPVLEALVARTIRHVEKTQRMTRLVGLSATLPNYVDVAIFLGVSLYRGMFFFDNRFRPVPLELSFIGIKATQQSQNRMDMDEVCFDKVREIVAKGEQVMVFVHARNATYKFATYLKEESCKQGCSALFIVDTPENTKTVNKTRNRMLKELIPSGFGIHHAGILRQDRNLVETAFKQGHIKVLVCTSTLAWGVNLPAHAVVIRGTDVYDSGKGDMTDVSMLDVAQIFGRAGRPQYDTDGKACIITSHEKLYFYLSMLTHQYPIESNFIKYLADNMNAEIVGRTVSNIDDAVEWMKFTYLLIRMQRNPLAYGLTQTQVRDDPHLVNKRRELAQLAAMQLQKAMMVIYDESEGTLDATDLGRVASYFYIKYDTIERFNEVVVEDMAEDGILNMLCQAQEFDQLKCREEEMLELMDIQKKACWLKVPGGPESRVGKVNILLQAYLSQWRLDAFSLISDSNFIAQNIVRITRGMFEYAIKSNWSHLAHKLLILSKMLEMQMWEHQHPLLQFQARELDPDTMRMLGRNKLLAVDRLRSDDFTSKDIGHLIRNESKGIEVKRFAYMLPWLHVEATAKPTSKTYRRIINGQQKLITSHVIKFALTITADFRWNDKYHGQKLEGFWLWIQDHDSLNIRHHEHLLMTKNQVVDKEPRQLNFSIHLPDPNNVPSHFILHVDSDKWLGCDIDEEVYCDELIEIHE